MKNMFYQDILVQETATLPEYLKRELVEFLFFLKKKEPQNALRNENDPEKNKPTFGCGSVKVKLAPDFDAPLEDFKDYMQ